MPETIGVYGGTTSFAYSTKEVRGIEELYRFAEPIGSMVDPKETIKFIEWLPDIEWHEAYVALLLVRSRELKERFGFKGSDHCLMIKFVPGYHRNVKLKLFLLLRRMALLAYHAPQIFIYERHADDEVEVYRIPRELVAVMLSPNPSRWVKASVDTCEEFMSSLLDAMMNPQNASNIVRRIDVRVGANAMRRVRHVFHLIDVDDTSLARELEEKIVEILGYLPARITTARGVHYLIKVSSFNKEMAKKWFSTIPKVVDELNNGREPQVIEYKKVFQEPVPGILYKGNHVPRFYPEER